MAARRFTTVAALLTIAVQFTLTASGALVVCANRQHTHNGRPAPDCPMHHGHDAPASQPAGHQHHHHSEPATDAGAQLACGCSASLPAFLVASPGVIAEPISIARPMTTSLTASQQPTTPREQSSAPLTPPPRPLIA